MSIVPVCESRVWVVSVGPLYLKVGNDLVVPTIDGQEHSRRMPNHVSDAKYRIWVGFETA